MALIHNFNPYSQLFKFAVVIQMLKALVGCILANKNPKMIIVAFGSISVRGNVSSYINIMDINI